MFTDTRTIGKKPSKRTLNQIDRKVDAIYRRHCSGIQISIMDIGGIFDAGRAVALAGGDDAAIAAAVLAKVAEVRK